MRMLMAALAACALLGCGLEPAEEEGGGWEQTLRERVEECFTQLCQPREPAPHTLSWSDNFVAFGDASRKVASRTLTVRNHGAYAAVVRVEIQGPFRIDPPEVTVPAFGTAEVNVLFDGEGVGETLGSLVIPLQGGEGVVLLHGQGSGPG